MASPTRVQAVDRKVGEAIRHRRKALGLSQEVLAAAVKISSQQVWKYETGGSRISASKLLDVARALKVPVAYFFLGLEDSYAEESAAATDAKVASLMASVEGKQLLDLFPQLETAASRKLVVDLLKAITNVSGAQPGNTKKL